MSVSPSDWPLGPPAPLPAAVLSVRSAVLEAVSGLLRVTDEALGLPWRWRGRDADVRYGFYRLYEALEQCAVDAAEALERAGARRTTAGRILAQATAARWDLHGLLLPLASGDFQREPGGGEWAVRQTLVHLISSQLSYSFRTAYAVHRVRAGRTDLPVVAPDEMLPSALRGMGSGGLLPDVQRRLDEAPNGAAQARQLLDEALDLGIGLLAGVDSEAELAAPTTWSGYDVTVRFRLHRWSSHLREHTIQVEKSLELLGRPPGEAERLVRLVLAAYGRLEGLTFGLTEGALERQVSGKAGDAALDEAARIVQTHARELVAAAGAGE